MMVLGHEPRQTTSNLGHLNKPSIQVQSVSDELNGTIDGFFQFQVGCSNIYGKTLFCEKRRP